MPCVPAERAGQTCAQIYGQTWGTVYDTINYTTTGALGDWFDSSLGLGADGIDNEMSFSHLDKNIVFEPQTEQLHVDGNKALIYAHLAELLAPATGRSTRRAARATCRHARRAPAAGPRRAARRRTRVAQADISRPHRDDRHRRRRRVPVRGPAPRPAGRPGIFDGGMRVDITVQNVQGIGSGHGRRSKVQCRGCDEHPGVTDDGRTG